MDARLRQLTDDVRVLCVPTRFTDDGDEILLDREGVVDHVAVVKSILDANTYGRATFHFDVAPLVTMPREGRAYNESEAALVHLRADAFAGALENGFDVSEYDLSLVFGIAHYPTAAAGIGFLNHHTAFMNQDLPMVTLHELGHAMSLGHANLLYVDPETEALMELIYGDRWDGMGGPWALPLGWNVEAPQYGPWSKLRLGWLDEAHITTVTESGTHSLQPYEADLSGTATALRIPATPDTDYWVFFRTDTGVEQTGPVVTRGYRNHNLNIMQTRLLDMTPASVPKDEDKVMDWQDAALVAGEPFTDDDAGISIELTSASADSVTVQVTRTGAAPAEVPVLGFLTPLPGEVVSGTVEYEVTAYDPAAGRDNGAGLEKVDVYLYDMFDDELLQHIRDGDELPEREFAHFTFSSPPFTAKVDTTSLDDGVYALLATTTGAGGVPTTMLAPHFIDNTGPTQ